MFFGFFIFHFVQYSIEKGLQLAGSSVREITKQPEMKAHSLDAMHSVNCQDDAINMKRHHVRTQAGTIGFGEEHCVPCCPDNVGVASGKHLKIRNPGNLVPRTMPSDHPCRRWYSVRCTGDSLLVVKRKKRKRVAPDVCINPANAVPVLGAIPLRGFATASGCEISTCSPPKVRSPTRNGSLPKTRAEGWN